MISLILISTSLLIVGVLSIVFGVMFIEEEHKPFGIVCVILGIVFLVLFFVLCCGGECYDEEVEADKVINLYSLESGSGVRGVFLLGTGSVNDVQYYIGYTNVRDNDYSQVKFDASKSILRLDDAETPRAEVNKIHSVKNFWDIILFDTDKRMTVLYIPTTGLKNVYEVN